MVRGRRRLAPLALALIALQLTAAMAGLEQVAVRHVVCAEHGAAIDVSLATPSTAVDPDDDYSDDNLAGHERSHAPGHEHCALAACDADAVVPRAVVVVAIAAFQVHVLPAAPAVSPPPAVSLLSVAPKTSPPG